MSRLTTRSNASWETWPLADRLVMRDLLRKQMAEREDFSRFAGKPVEYAHDRLRVTLTSDQQRILLALLDPPYRVMVPSGHDTGKTFVAAVAVNYWYDTHPVCGVMTLGPRHDSLKDTVWAEIRLQRMRAGLALDFIGPSAPEMRSGPDHWAKALTASKDASLTGRHLPFMFFLIEEACAVDPVWWTVVMTMFDASLGHAQLCIFNPTDVTSQAYLEDQQTSDPDGVARWHRFRLSALNHPNIKAELEGREKEVPHAVSLATVRGWIKDWCTPLGPNDERRATDFEFPDGSGLFYRPGPEFLARALGLWPEDPSGLWSEPLFEACCGAEAPPFPIDRLPQIGCDTALGKGADFHAIHARWGDVSFHHETANTMDPVAIFSRLKEVAALAAALVNRHRQVSAAPVKPQDILIALDDDGVGRSIAAFLWRDGYACVPVGAATAASNPDRYPNKRSELWFSTADRARLGGVHLSGIDPTALRRLRRQFLPVLWQLDGRGRRVVEPKADMKDRLGRSPDDADAVNLAYLEGLVFERPPLGPEMMRRVLDPALDRQRDERRERLFGR